MTKKLWLFGISSGLKCQNSFSSFAAVHVILLKTWLLILGQPNPMSDARDYDYSFFRWKTFRKVHLMCKGPVLFFKTTKYEDAQVFKAFLKPYPFLIKCEILYCGTCSATGYIISLRKLHQLLKTLEHIFFRLRKKYGFVYHLIFPKMLSKTWQ